MKKGFALFLLVGLMFGCTDGFEEEAEQRLDLENSSFIDGKSDTILVEPDTRESVAVLKLVNRTLNSDTEADAFFILLDSVLHKQAARNIVDFRIGDDGVVGGSDKTFADLGTLDRIAYVGPFALQQLLILAESEGLLEDTDLDAESAAVLKLVNRTLNTDVDANDFFNLLDSVLHKQAARNIVDFRIGNDAVVGGSDDKRFADMGELDDIAYVGSSALAQLLILAESEGLLNHTQVDENCAEFFREMVKITQQNGIPSFISTSVNPADDSSYSNSTSNWGFLIENSEDMIRLENSGCNYIPHSLVISTQNDYLLTRARSLEYLSNIRRIDGEVFIYKSSNITSLNGLKDIEQLEGITAYKSGLVEIAAFTSLRHLDYVKVLHADALRRFSTSRSSLVSLGSLKLMFGNVFTLEGIENVETIEGKLSIWMDDDVVIGFTKLTTVGEIELKGGRIFGDFPALKTTDSLNLEITKPLSSETKTSSISFSALESVNSIFADDLHGELELDNLKTIEATLLVGKNTTLDAPKLNHVHTLSSNATSITFPSLETAYNITMNGLKTETEVTIFPELTQTQRLAVSIDLRANTILAPKLRTVQDISIILSGSYYYATTLEVAKSLETVGRNFTIKFSTSRYVKGFDSLEAIGGKVTFSHPNGFGTIGFAPRLHTVDGDVFVTSSSSGFTLAQIGFFKNLESINGQLHLGGVANLDEMVPFDGLKSLGGFLILRRNAISEEGLDNFLDNLEYFTGNLQFF